MRIYLDHNATAPMLPNARAAATEAMALPGNASSIHAEGRAARQVVEQSRKRVADLFGGASDEVVFTGGGTEADALGAIGLARLARARGSAPVVWVCPTVHPALHGAIAQLALEGFAVRWLAVNEHGRIKEFSGGNAALVAVSAANHETGVMQDLPQLRAWAGAVPLMVDAVQWAGKRALAEVVACADAVAISAHKLGGGKGIGALWVRREHAIAPVIAGGHQERERRPGTEHIAAMAGFAAAADTALACLPQAGAICDLAASFEAQVRVLDGAEITAQQAPRIGNTVNVRFAGTRGDAVAMALDVAGIAVSNGAACTSGSVKPSPVLLAMGLSEDHARQAVRFSFGASNTSDHVAQVMSVLPAIVARARRFG